MSLRRESVKKTPFKASVSKRLEILRNHLGLDTKAMAAKMNINVRTYRTNGRGEHAPAAESLATLAKTTNASLDWLLTGRGGIFYRDVETETQRALEAERAAMEAQKKTDSFLREIEEMKHLMQQVPIVKHMVMAYYQEVKEEKKEIIHRQLEKQETIIKQPAPPAYHQEPEPPAIAVRKTTEPLPEVLHTEAEIQAVVNEEPEAPPAVILKDPEAPTDVGPKEIESPPTVTKESGKPAPTKVKNLFSKKRKKKRK
ncbi:MAG: helix-turn-helix transcriptional regulator [bacterium]|nr:helix-turn-helix transcriptional regulator [bacterium]